jgi:endogenous inhibitor of DNA gyrase (YacG/DUF329 family)
MVKRKKQYSCLTCGKLVEDWIIRKRKFCSIKCSLLSSAGRRKGKGKYR